jgi:hypothetical protein
MAFFIATRENRQFYIRRSVHEVSVNLPIEPLRIRKRLEPEESQATFVWRWRGRCGHNQIPFEGPHFISPIRFFVLVLFNDTCKQLDYSE